MSLRIREYRPTDLAEIHAINQAAYPAVGSETLDDLGDIAAASTIALVLEDDDGTHGDGDHTGAVSTVAGFCLVLAPGARYDSMNYLWFVERYDDFVYLDRVAIAPAYHRRGLGRALYAEVERLAAERRPGARHFTLEVNLRPRNDQSLAFHAELGFVEVGQQETDYGALVSLMAKSL